MQANEQLAEQNRDWFRKNNVTAINIMASPGAGKTSLITGLIRVLGNERQVAVIEGDIASSIDAEKIEALGAPVIQINTGGGCHLDANMIGAVLPDLGLQPQALLLIENVGNLVCPSAFDLGEKIKLVVASVPEGHDKPYKYLSMFEAADGIVLNKIDLMPYIDFDREAFYRGIRALNSKAPVFEVSFRTGEGVKELACWIQDISGGQDSPA